MVTIDLDDFMDIMTTKMSERDGEEQLKKAFILFSQEKDHITFEDLERIANELGENMTGAELQQMIEEAESYKPEATGVVQIEDFMNILKTQSWAKCSQLNKAMSNLDPDGQLLITFASTFVLITLMKPCILAYINILKQIKCKKIINFDNILIADSP